MIEINDLTDSLPVHPTKKPKKQKKIKRIVVHTTNWVCTEQELAEYDIKPNHISKTGCPTSTYHYTVRQDGTINHCVPTDVVTWHAGPWNPKSLAVSFVYKTDKKYEKARAKGVTDRRPKDPDNAPTVEAHTALLKLLSHLCIEHKVEPTQIFGHRELKGTGWTFKKGSKRLRKTCPGMAVDLQWTRQAVAKIIQQLMYDKGLYSSSTHVNPIDGLWGERSKAAFKILVEE